MKLAGLAAHFPTIFSQGYECDHTYMNAASDIKTSGVTIAIPAPSTSININMVVESMYHLRHV
jgi:hypothetical protein